MHRILRPEAAGLECSTLREARSDFGGIVGYVPKTAKWDVPNGAMSFQTRPSTP